MVDAWFPCYSTEDLVDFGLTQYGTVDDSQVVYVEDNASSGGTISGAGILPVNPALLVSPVTDSYCWGRKHHGNGLG